MTFKLYYGAAYYPELWDERTLDEDIVLMKEAGINVVRIAEFSWSTLEPHQDDFRADYFTAAIEKLYAHGIETVVCTPTPTPPIWISHNHPERMIRDEKNVTMSHGGRQQVCTNNAYFRKRASLIIVKMAQIYGKLEGVIAWQIDNELKGNVAECYCESCKDLWRQWLEEKYGTINALNQLWGTHIWSQFYEQFDQVPQPFSTPMGHSPSLNTAYRLFSRDLAAEFVKEQAELIRNYSELPITHNACLNHYIDNEKLFSHLDFTAFDHYSISEDYQHMLFHLDTYKTLKRDKPFWVMETAPSFSGNGYGYQTVHQQGYLKAESAAAFALGAGGFNYWLWRQQKNGIEQSHGSIISSWGKPAIGFNSVAEAARMKDKLEKVFAKTLLVKAELAVTYSDTARAFFMSEKLEPGEVNYTDMMRQWHQIILNAGLYRDVIFENESLADYKILMSPYLPSVTADYLERATRFVEEGGIWIVGPLTGIRTAEHTINTDFSLGKLEKLAGVRTVYHYPITGSGAIGVAFGEKAALTLWSNVFECIEAKGVGYVEGGVSPGLPFITESTHGKGKIVMIGSMPSGDQGQRMLQNLITHYSLEAGVIPLAEPTKGTIVIPRQGSNIHQWVIINMDGKGGSLQVPWAYKDAFTNLIIEAGTMFIEPFDCRVIEF